MRGSSGLAQRLLRPESAPPAGRASWKTTACAAHPRGICSQPPAYGSPRLAASGCQVMIALPAMRLERIFARQRSKYRVATTDARHGGPLRQPIAQPRRSTLNQVWSAITAVLTAPGLVVSGRGLDLRRRVVGWAMSQIDATLVMPHCHAR
jgi:hypothetical protein